MNSEEVDIQNGKTLLYVLFGASRWDFQRIDEAETLPSEVEGYLERLRGAAMYLMKNWKQIHPEDRSMGEAGITEDISLIRSSGFSIVGTLTYGMSGESGDLRKYNALLRIARNR